MDQGLWSELPAALLEQVLPFLLVPDLSRFRVVCKRWNNLISSPEFGKLCVLNASKSASEGACLVVKLRVHSSFTGEDSLMVPHIHSRNWKELPGWSILDPSAKRWYNLKHELPKGYDDIAAMDGGLVCAFVDSWTEEQRLAPNCIFHQGRDEHQTLVMFNLFGGASKVLPNPPFRFSLSSLNLNLIVENTSNTYKILLVNTDFVWEQNPCLSMYESSTGQWRNPPNPPGSKNHPRNRPNPPDSENHWRGLSRITIFQGLLYLLCSCPTDAAMVWSYNFLEDSWEDTGVLCPYKIVEISDLIVSDNRLFLMTQFIEGEGARESRSFSRSLDINEILLADKECRRVVRMEHAEVMRNLIPEGTFTYGTRAFGLNKSILLMSSPQTGKIMLYNLATGQWESLPQNSLEVLCLGTTRRIGTQMSYLRLPTSPW